MEFWGVVILLAGAIVLGLARYYLIQPQSAYAGGLTAIAALVGGFVASEYLGRLSEWGTAWYGLNIFPAMIGAVALAVIVDVAVRFMVTREVRV
jgi:uncharacterized membrane protein YeaQ/YmgE (transglycosylase-associated protein family)